MKIKHFISIFLLFFIFANSNAQSKADTVRKISWAVRVAGGVNMLRYIVPDKNSDENYNVYSDNIDGNVAQIGIKISTMPRKILSFSSELNYAISEYQLKYTGSTLI